MEYLVYLCYPILFILLLFGAKLFKKGEWNEGFLSLEQTKALQGFLAVCVVLHHIAQKTCASWLKEEYIVHGLDLFVPIGYLFVGVFLFCSGYGLYRSYQEKEDYLKGFFGKRMLLPLLAFAVTNVIFFVARIRMGDGENAKFTQPFRVTGPDSANPYVWFVFALMTCYLGFYLGFRFLKKDGLRIGLVTLIVFLYMLHCDFWVYGTWWYNSVFLFPMGLLFAWQEPAITEKLKKHYPVFLGLTALLFFAAFFLGEENCRAILSLIPNLPYGVSRWMGVVLQNLAAGAFSLFVIMLGMKVKIGNRALSFLGTITLELYLIHGLFVQLFGFCFIKDYLDPLYYIRNAGLFTAVVFLLSVPLACGLHIGLKFVTELLIRKKSAVKSMWDYLKKPAFGLLIVMLLITLFYGITSYRKSRDARDEVQAYRDENIVLVEVDGEKMGTVTFGTGDHTIVMLAGDHDPCPSITLKPLAERLSEQNKVIILEYFGHGFSDDTKKERTAEHFVEEIHTALEQLGEKGPYILMPHTSSGLYARLYTETYPDEVEAVIGLESYVGEQIRDTLNIQRLTPGEYEKILKRSGESQYFAQRIFELTGFVRIQCNYYRQIFRFSRKEDLNVLEEMSVRQYSSMNSVQERVYAYRNAKPVTGKPYPEDLPVLFLLGNYSAEGKVYGEIDWEQLHRSQLSNPEIQEIKILQGNQYFVYYNVDAIAKNAQEFINMLGQSK